MNIHILCPFYRKNLLPTLINYLEPTGIIWHPLCDPIDMTAFYDNDKSWIQPILCPPFNPTDMCYRKINDFLDTKHIIDDDYYGFMGDDDMYEPGFFDVIRQQTSKIIVYCLSRGDTTPECDTEQHPAMSITLHTLDDIRTFNIGLGMYILKGSILKQTRFGNVSKFDDGAYAENLKAKFPDDIKILSDLYIFGNYFQPGRYTNDNWKIKSNWELPKII